jgi:hypothetical protein
MRTTIKQAAAIAFAGTVVLGGVLYLRRDALRVRYHLWVLQGAEQALATPRKSPTTFFGAFSEMLRPRWEDCEKAFERHEEALVRLGYLSRQEFLFTSRTLNAAQLMTNAQARFSTRMTTLCVLTNGQPLSASSVCTSSVVRVTAPKSEEQKWSALIREFDKKEIW